MPFGALVVNRVAIDTLPESTLARLEAVVGGGPAEGKVEALVENYLLYRNLAERDRRSLAGLAGLGIDPARMLIVPMLEDEVARIAGLRNFLRALKPAARRRRPPSAAPRSG